MLEPTQRYDTDMVLEHSWMIGTDGWTPETSEMSILFCCPEKSRGKDVVDVSCTMCTVC